MLNKIKLAVLAGAMALSFSASADLIVDDFSVPQGPVSASASAPLASSSVNDGNILGGSRDLIVQWTGGESSSALATMVVENGALSFSEASGVIATGTVRWDGANTGLAIDPTGLGGIDLTQYGSFFEITVLESDLGFSFFLEAYTSATQWSRLTLSADEVLFGSPETFYIPFAAFLAPSAILTTGVDGAVDFTDVGALQGVINPGGARNIDLRIDLVRVVPEPASLALLGLGLIGLGAIRRRKTA